MKHSVPRWRWWCILLCAATGCQGLVPRYGRPWNGYDFHTYPHPAKKPAVPRDVMVDVINNLGLKLLAIHNEYNENNIAISPYGALSVLVALGEGLRGDAVREIQQAAHIPNDISVIRIGLRDIHRHLKSYFIPKEGFLAGLTLNHDNVTLRPEYEEILKFYGYDSMAFNNALYPEPETTENPPATTFEITTTQQQTTATIYETTTEITTTTETMARESGITETLTSTTVTTHPEITTNTISTSPTTTPVPVATEVLYPTTTGNTQEPELSINQLTTMVTESTIAVTDSSTTAVIPSTIENVPEPEFSTNRITTAVTTPPVSTITTTDLATTVFVPSTTENTMVSVPSTSVPLSVITVSDSERALSDSTMLPDSTTTVFDSATSATEQVTALTTVTEPTTITVTPIIPTESATVVEINSNTTVGYTEMTTTETQIINLSTVSISPMTDAITATTGEQNEATTTFEGGTTEEMTTGLSATEPVFVTETKSSILETTAEARASTTATTSNDATTTNLPTTDIFSITATSGATETLTSSPLPTESSQTFPPVTNYFSSTLSTADETTSLIEVNTDDLDVTTEKIDNQDNEILHAEGFGGTFKRSARSELNRRYYSNFETSSREPRSVVDYLIARHYDDRYIPNMNRRPYIPEDQLSFLVYGKFREYQISFMKYDAVLPFYYVHHLGALALSFPLDSSNYYLLLLLPIDDTGIDQLVCDLRLNGSLRYIIENLRYTHVVATIPSFMLKGYVTLTPTFQKLGVRKVFEPRQADFSKMTSDKQIYVTNIEQAITVNIRNYVDPNTLDNHRDLRLYDPVEFKADHPFLYFVLDSELHVTLMSGKVVNPLNSRIG